MRLFVFGLGYSAHALIVQRTVVARFAGTVRTHEKARTARPERHRGLQLRGRSSGIADEVSTSGRRPGLDAAYGRQRSGLCAIRRSSSPLRGPACGLATCPRPVCMATSPADGSTRRFRPSREASARPVASRLRRNGCDWARTAGLNVAIFRLSGIYGPGRNAFVALARGTAQRIVKPGQVSNRIHVEDIATVLSASIDRPRPGAIYNVSDNEPAPPQDIIAFAAQLAGIPEPPSIPFDQAELSPMSQELLRRKQAHLEPPHNAKSSASGSAIRPIARD